MIAFDIERVSIKATPKANCLPPDAGRPLFWSHDALPLIHSKNMIPPAIKLTNIIALFR
jgi:hypothetical protein